ncbi:MAG: hypothetical protein LBN34_07955 [Clostridiales Family XIII bacterium]|nr:hypothetical protein [Clostridiales Family XIII bacterium]
MNRVVKITYRFFGLNTTGGHCEYSVEKAISQSDSLRSIAIDIARDSMGKIDDELLTNNPTFIDENPPIWFYLENCETEISYGINPDGTIQFLANDLNEKSYHNWTLAEIDELIDNGILSGNKNHIRFLFAEGVGGGSCMEQVVWIVDWILRGYGLLTASHATVKFTKAVKDMIVHKWKKRGIKTMRQFRDFFDTKTAWTTKEVMKYLGITEEVVSRTLLKLGYELVDNEWRISQSKTSIDLREAWIKREVEVSSFDEGPE